jgi:hypothetical protein
MASGDTPLPSFIFSFAEDDSRCGSGGKPVAMMQAAEPWHGKDLGACRRTFRSFSESRSLFIQTKMCSVVVIIADVLNWVSI